MLLVSAITKHPGDLSGKCKNSMDTVEGCHNMTTRCTPLQVNTSALHAVAHLAGLQPMAHTAAGDISGTITCCQLSLLRRGSSSHALSEFTFSALHFNKQQVHDSHGGQPRPAMEASGRHLEGDSEVCVIGVHDDNHPTQPSWLAANTKRIIERANEPGWHHACTYC